MLAFVDQMNRSLVKNSNNSIQWYVWTTDHYLLATGVTLSVYFHRRKIIFCYLDYLRLKFVGRFRCKLDEVYRIENTPVFFIRDLQGLTWTYNRGYNIEEKSGFLKIAATSNKEQRFYLNNTHSKLFKVLLSILCSQRTDL